MDDEQSKKYESIDALIKAAEVLERNEYISKSQMSFENNNRLSKIFARRNNAKFHQSRKKLNLFKNNLNIQSNERFSDSLMQTIECIKDLRSDERWYSLIERKLESDNRALYKELNHLKRKLNKIQHMTSTANKWRSVDKSFEDEDTSTASEDEDHNKYGSKTFVENVDDATDDASECEEISQISQNNKIYRLKHIRKREIDRSKFFDSDNHSVCSRNNVPSATNRKRKRTAHIYYSPDFLKTRHPSMKDSDVTLSQSIWNNYVISDPKCVRSMSVSQCGLIPASDNQVSSKIHRIA